MLVGLTKQLPLPARPPQDMLVKDPTLRQATSELGLQIAERFHQDVIADVSAGRRLTLQCSKGFDCVITVAQMGLSWHQSSALWPLLPHGWPFRSALPCLSRGSCRAMLAMGPHLVLSFSGAWHCPLPL